jgi:serine/threonine protein kinase
LILSYYISYSHGLSENIAKVIFKHLLQFIRFCLSKNIYYFDINPSNIIFDNQNKIKIIDYGNAHFFQNQNMIFNKDYCKNELKSPEMWEKNEFKGEKSIIFILGAFLFNLVTGKYGFQKSEKNDKLYILIINGANDNYEKYWDQIGKLNINKDFSDNFNNLYISMVQYNT